MSLLGNKSSSNFAKFYGTFQTKCKALSLIETKDFWKDNLKQAVAVLQNSRESQLAIKAKFIVLID